MRKKKWFLIFFCLFLFFVGKVDDVWAYTCKDNGIYADRIVRYDAYDTYRKIICINGSPHLAYCADKGKNAPKAKNAMKVNKAFSKSNVCVAKDKAGKDLNSINGVSSSNLDCSTMVGYIIEYANKKGKGWSDSKLYGRTQRAIQSFLYDSGEGNWRSENKRFNYKYIYGDEGIIPLAFKAYAKNISKLNSDNYENDSVLTVSFSVDGNDTKMYYDNKSDYKSYKVTANVSCTGKCTGTYDSITLSTARQDTEICNNSWSNCSTDSTLTFNNKKNNNRSVSFYVKTKSKNPTAITGSVAYTSLQVSVTSTIPDSVMYVRKIKPSKVQKLVVPVSANEKKTYGGDVVDFSGSITLTPEVVKSTTCDKIFSGYSKLSSGSNNVKDKVCASNTTSSDSSNKSVAEYKNCTDSTSSISFYTNASGTCKLSTVSVSVSLANYGKFRYGNVVGDSGSKKILRRGGGFYLQNVSGNSFISSDTYFVSKVSWDYNTLYRNNLLYFYIDPMTGIHHNSLAFDNSNCSGSGVSIDQYVANKMKTEINKKFKFDNQAQSDYVNKLSSDTFVTVKEDGSSFKVPVRVSVNSGASSEMVSEFNSKSTKTFYYSFLTPYAYYKNSDFSINYAVDTKKYSSSDYTYAGERFYTYNKYVEDKFPINISAVNSLSLIKGMNWSLDADCDMEFYPPSECPPDENCDDLYECTDDGSGKVKCYLNYRYRSISVSDPFPKATVIAELPNNWKEWWSNNSNRKRIMNTFDNGLFYKVYLDSNVINKINTDYKTSYTSWDNINNNGESKFVSKYSSSSSDVKKTQSFCPLGRWDADTCDKW